MKRSLLVATAALVAVLGAASAAPAAGPNGKQLYRYAGEFESTNGSTLTLTVENGNRPALRSLLGQSQVQTFSDRLEDGVPEVEPRKAHAGRHRRSRRARLGDRQRPQRSWRLSRHHQGHGRSDRRRPRPVPGQADAAALPVQGHLRLRRRGQGHDRRQGRQPARIAPHDRPDRTAVVHLRPRDRLPPLGPPDPDGDRREHAPRRGPDPRSASARRGERRSPGSRPRRRGGSQTASRCRRKRTRTPAPDESTPGSDGRPATAGRPAPRTLRNTH